MTVAYSKNYKKKKKKNGHGTKTDPNLNCRVSVPGGTGRYRVQLEMRENT